MYLNYKSQVRPWLVYFVTVIIAIFIHEIGHCIVAWSHGIKAIPTPAKAYYLQQNISPGIDSTLSLGGIIGTISFSLAVVAIFLIKKFSFSSAVFAGALANPGLYALLFLLKGRGHDGTEFQEAQAVLGQSYSGHFLDWFFLSIFIVGTVIWIIGRKPSYKLLPKIALGVILSFVFLGLFQDLNNKIFDPIFIIK